MFRTIFCRLLILLAVIGQTGQTCGLFVVHEQFCPESDTRESSHIHSAFELLDGLFDSEEHRHVHNHHCHHHNNATGFIPACSHSDGCCLEHSVTVEAQYNLTSNVLFDATNSESVCIDVLFDFDRPSLPTNFRHTLFTDSPRYLSYCSLLI